MCRDRDDGGHVCHGDWTVSAAARMDWFPAGKHKSRSLAATQHTHTQKI